MLVPKFWAEGRVQHRERGRQITVRRFGWSDLSQADAQVNADQRAQDALQRVMRGEKLPRRDRKVAYNGADGLPIREEIVSRHGDSVITRNSYGARCLNSPDVLFLDIDFSSGPSCALMIAVLFVQLTFAIVVGWSFNATGYGAVIGVAVFFLSLAFPIAERFHWFIEQAKGGQEKMARDRIVRFLDKNPAWHLRLYRTPAGLRAMAMHRTFQPDEQEVAECFSALCVDPIYGRMCRNQKCFRARVSPKPWRIKIDKQIRLGHGVWPVPPEQLPFRERWVEAYETAARDFAACRFLESLGNPNVDSKADEVRRLHDEMCRSDTELPIA